MLKRKCVKNFIILLLALTLLMSFPLAGFAASDAPVLLQTGCFSQKGKVYCDVAMRMTAGQKYRIYRRLASAKKYQKLADVYADSQQLTFRDKSIQKNQCYYYTARRIYKNK